MGYKMGDVFPDGGLIYTVQDGVFINFEEGTGDNLLPEDIEAGYVDYINWESFKINRHDAYDVSIEQDDGGMLLLKEYYADCDVGETMDGLLYESSHENNSLCKIKFVK